MRLWDLVPERIKALPLPLRVEDLARLRHILNSPRGKRFQLLVYVCRKGHVLAEVVGTASGHVLIVYGLRGAVPSERSGPDMSWGEAFADMRMLSRHHDWAMRLDDLTPYLEVFPAAEPVVRCRCGRHTLDLSAVVTDTQGDRRRVVLDRTPTAR